MVEHAECGAGGTPGSSTCGSSSRIGRGQREFFLTTLRAVAHVVDFDKALLALRSNGDDHVAVAATNRDLASEVEAGRFRPDLYYRLSVIPIELPPLRAHREAIAPLAHHFLTQLSADMGVAALALDEEALQQLQTYSWPGNVRELQNVIERAVILSRGDRLSLDLGIGPASPSRVLVRHDESPAVLTESDLRHLEQSNLEAALRVAKGRVYGRGGAAELLGVPPTTFTDRIRRFGIDAGQWRRGADNGHRHR